MGGSRSRGTAASQKRQRTGGAASCYAAEMLTHLPEWSQPPVAAQSFRWQSEEQTHLADDLRSGTGVILPTDPADLDVAIALFWKDLWAIGGGVLPLAYHSFKGGYEEAAATILLNHVTRNVLDLDATYLGDALTALNIEDSDVPRQLELDLQGVIETLKTGTAAAVRSAYLELVAVIGTVSARTLRRPHAAHTSRLAALQSRMTHPGRPVPGLTTHQAKGGEWDIVGVSLRDNERKALGASPPPRTCTARSTSLRLELATARSRSSRRHHRRRREAHARPPPTPSRRLLDQSSRGCRNCVRGLVHASGLHRHLLQGWRGTA